MKKGKGNYLKKKIRKIEIKKTILNTKTSQILFIYKYQNHYGL